MDIEKIQDSLSRHLAAGDTYLAVSTLAVLVNELADHVDQLRARLEAVEGASAPPPPSPARRLVQQIIGRQIIPPVESADDLPVPPPCEDATCAVCQFYDWDPGRGKWVSR